MPRPIIDVPSADSGWIALMQAVQHIDGKEVSRLLNLVGNYNQIDKLGKSALIMALETLGTLKQEKDQLNMIRIIREIVFAGADLSITRKEDGYDALTIAAVELQDEDLVDFLLRQGAEKQNYKGEYGGNLLMLAAQEQCNIELLTLLTKNISQDVMKHVNKYDYNAFMVAVINKNVQAVKFFLDRNLGTEEILLQRDKTGCNALMLAAASGETDIVNIVLDSGLSKKVIEEMVWAENQDQSNALVLAIEAGHNDTVKAFLHSDQISKEMAQEVIEKANLDRISSECRQDLQRIADEMPVKIVCN